jgi:signal transduction histidine kinase
MIRTVKKALPSVVFILLGTVTCLLLVSPSRSAILIGGCATTLTISLLFYAVIRWDEELAEEERQRRQLAEVVDRTLDPIVIADATGQLVYANDAATASYGLPEDISECDIGIVGLEADQCTAVVATVLETGHWDGEVHYGCGHDAQAFLIKMFRMDALRGNHTAIVCVARDTTERKQLEVRLRSSQKLAAVGELAAGVAHEINNPLAAVQSQVGLARDLLELGDPDVETSLDACLEQAGQAVQRCTRIVDSLLRFSRKETDVLIETDVPATVQQTIDFITTLPKMKGVTVQVTSPPLTPTVRSNAESIGQILANIVINAADAAGSGGTVRVSTSVEGMSVVIHVEDDGPGIPEEHITRVFEPFFTTKQVGQGTGLGLSISYGIAEAIGARLALSSPATGGTVARLSLPITAPIAVVG